MRHGCGRPPCRCFSTPGGYQDLTYDFQVTGPGGHPVLEGADPPGPERIDLPADAPPGCTSSDDGDAGPVQPGYRAPASQSSS